MAVAIVNHIYYPALIEGGVVYCHWRDKIVEFTDAWFYENCCLCPYAVGRGNDGSGIEQEYWDPTLKPYDPVEMITDAQHVQDVYARTRGLEKKTGREAEYMTAPKDVANLTLLLKGAYVTQKAAEAPRSKYDVYLNDKKKGTVYFGDEVAFEVTTQDPQLEALSVVMVTNPIQPSTGVSKIGDPDFEDAAIAFLEESGYELREAA